jgi:hypothetical protein
MAHAQRLTRKLTDVIAEVEAHLKAHYNVTQKKLDSWRQRASVSTYTFPTSHVVDINRLWIDYEVQRDVNYKHLLSIIEQWDPRICGPGSACRFIHDPKIYLYDAQHRTIIAGLLGFTYIPCAIVETDDPNFPSYAFEMLNEKGVKRLTPGDLHRNALVRYKNGSRERVNLLAFNMQMAFDTSDVDLEDKNTRNNPNLRGSSDYFFSHFKYAQKAVELDGTGMLLRQMLEAITGVYKLGSEVDQGVFIGLYELQRMASVSGYSLPNGWMKQVLTLIKQRFNSSNLVHDRAKLQFFHKFPGATWSAPSAMSEFMREIYMLEGGQIPLPTHGIGACLDVATNPAPGLFPVVVQSAHPTTMVAA